jgi:hypothetical protein
VNVAFDERPSLLLSSFSQRPAIGRALMLGVSARRFSNYMLALPKLISS